MMSPDPISTASNPQPGDYVEVLKEGTIIIEGSYFISGIHNHYPSGGEPQNFASTIEILDKANKHVARIRFENFDQRVRKDNVVHDIVPAPTMTNDVLQVPQPLSALPLWEMILTKLPAGDYAIVYGVSHKKSWAFLRPNKSPLRHKIGG